MEQLLINPFATSRNARNSVIEARMNEQRNALEQQEAKARLEAQRRAQETAALQGRGAQSRYAFMFPDNRPAMPAQGAQMAPQGQMRPAVVGGAPLTPQQPEIDPASGKTIDSYTAQSSRQPKFLNSEGIKREMQTYAQANRWDLVGQIAPKYEEALKAERQSGLEEEQKGYDLNTKTMESFAGWSMSAVPYFESLEGKPGWENEINRAVQDLATQLNREGLDGNLIMQQAKIDPGDTPRSIAQELRGIIARFQQKDAAQNFYLPFQRQDLGNRVGVFDQRTGEFGGGPSIGVSPNTVASNRTSITTAGISADSRVQAAKAAATIAAASGKFELVPQDDLPEGQ
jgi:hypothetical protein